MGNVWLTWAADAARNAVRGTGYQVVEVAGWQSRGHGGFRVVEGIVGHHTGTSDKAKGDYPSLRIVRDGRSDLPGPLCNYGLGRSGTIYVVAAGVAWHAGASRYAGFVDLNDEFAGIEAESAGAGGWTADQRFVYPRLVGAFLSYIRRPATRYCSHRTCALPPGRKPDPKGIDDGWMISSADAFMRGASVAPVRRKADRMISIPIEVRSDHTFYEATMAEVDSAVYGQAWCTFGSTWGHAEFVITALSPDGRVLAQWKRTQANNTSGYVELPPGTRQVTVEGRTESTGTRASAAIVMQPR